MERHLDYVARNVLRYTSYPTAPHFTEEVNGATGAAWMVVTDYLANPTGAF